MKQLFSSTLVAVMVIACCYGSVSALEAPDMRASLKTRTTTATTPMTIRMRQCGVIKRTIRWTVCR